jgi:hypothetical protein
MTDQEKAQYRQNYSLIKSFKTKLESIMTLQSGQITNEYLCGYIQARVDDYLQNYKRLNKDIFYPCTCFILKDNKQNIGTKKFVIKINLGQTINIWNGKSKEPEQITDIEI